MKGPENLRPPFSGGRKVLPSLVNTAPQFTDADPSISPTGRWLYFQLDHKNLYRVPGPAQYWRQSSPEKITDYPDSNLFLEDPQLSHDGRQLLYTRGHITGDIWILSFGKDWWRKKESRAPMTAALHLRQRKANHKYAFAT